MSESPTDEAEPKHEPLAALRQRNFAFYLGYQLLSGIGSSVLEASMAWQLYAISHSPLELGLLGLIRFVPSLLLSVVGGAFADTYNRRNIIMVTRNVPITCAIVLAVASFGGWVRIELIYGLVMCMGFSSAFEGAASQSLLPGIVRPETFANAVTISAVGQTIGSVSGPFFGGLIISFGGAGAAYVTVACLIAAGVTMLPLIKYTQAPSNRGLSVEMVREGLRFVWKNQVLLGAMTLDMFAVIFGGAKALLPVYASDILHVGPRGYGLLGASFEAGAFAMSMLLVFAPPIQRSGRALIYTIVFFGIGTIAFGLSHTFLLSLAVYFSIGLADQISVVMRRTTIQLATPDELRGRVSAVGQVFIGASNQLGGLESGLVASLSSPQIAVVTGGIGTLISVGLIAWRLPLLYNYRIPRRNAEPVAEPAADAAEVAS